MNKIKVVYYTIFEYRGENMENFISILNSNYLYKEVIKNVIDPLEIIREAISNSIDAEARNIEIRIFKNENSKFSISIKDNGNGMNYEEIQSFFNLGYSKDVKEHMQNATAFLMCSENEGLGRVTVESMFYGCLVIGKSSGGTKEIVKDGVTGYLFDDEAECASLMRKCAEKDNTAIIRKAQEYACSTFSQEDYGNKIQSVYDKVLHGDSKVGSH